MLDCIFCKIGAHEIPVTAIYEDGQCLAFADLSPQAPTHFLVIPKQHFTHVAEAPSEVLGHLVATSASLGQHVLPHGFRIVINTGPDGGQTVHHLHLHVLGGRPLSWPPG